MPGTSGIDSVRRDPPGAPSFLLLGLRCDMPGSEVSGIDVVRVMRPEFATTVLADEIGA